MSCSAFAASELPLVSVAMVVKLLLGLGIWVGSSCDSTGVSRSAGRGGWWFDFADSHVAVDHVPDEAAEAGGMDGPR
jgi:hypothetical protein